MQTSREHEHHETSPIAHAVARAQLPEPTPRFRREAWITLQRALDPLAPPRPLRPPRR